MKNEWNVFKKEIKKEIAGHSKSFQYDFTYYMTSRQIANKNATIGIQNKISYDEEIKRCSDTIDRVMGYATWSDEQKAKTKATQTELIKKAIEAKMTFGTKLDEAKVALEMISKSRAWEKFCDSVNVSMNMNLEETRDAYMIRISW